MEESGKERRAQPWALGIGIAGAALMLAAAAVAARKRLRGGSAPPRPGDEAAPGTPQTGEGLCPTCSGKGVVGGRRCEVCLGTGTVVVNIGDA